MELDILGVSLNWCAASVWRLSSIDSLRIASGKFISAAGPAMLLTLASFGMNTDTWAVPTVVGTTMNVQINTPSAPLDLAQFITGTGVTGVSISTQPLHGTVNVYGTKVTYIPAKDYFGTDLFNYIGYDAGGASSPATVTVSISGRPDPTTDARVKGLVHAQTAAVKHFGASQVFNYQQRMESRHQNVYLQTNTSALTDSGGFSTSSGSMPAALGRAPAPTSSALSGLAVDRFVSWEPGTSMSYANDQNTMSYAQEQTNNGQPANSDSLYVLRNMVTGSATDYSLNLASISSAINPMNGDTQGSLDLWAAGNLRFGTSSVGGSTTQFSTDGVSIGLDKRVSRNLMVGMGFGYARDNSTIGTDGTNDKSSGDGLAGYASYMMDSGTFIDGLLGYGKINLKANRYVAVNDFAQSSRKGSQIFGSLSLGYEYRKDALLWSPYGRYDFSYEKLNQSVETGAGANALSYDSQKSHSSSLAFGLRGQTMHQTEYGLVQPRARIEYQRGLETTGQTSVAYADLLAPQYSVAGTSQNIHSVVIGLGSDFLLSDTLKIEVDYQHLGSNGAENYQSINILLTKTLKGLNDLPTLLDESESSSATKSSGTTVEAGIAYDDNVTRASNTRDKLVDSIYSLRLRKSLSKVLSKRHRLTVTGFLDTEMFHTYAGLDNLTGGVQGEYAYRNSGEFGTPTYSIFARLSEDKYNSELRNGTIRSAGVSYRNELSNYINFYSVLSANARTGKSEVFNTHDRSARMNFDYQLDQDQTVYLTGEFRKGDIVSSGRSSLHLIDISNWYVPDDALNTPGFFDYRFKGHTVLWSLGYNISFGSKDSFDVSWRHAKSTSDMNSTAGMPVTYLDNFYSINYLLSF